MNDKFKKIMESETRDESLKLMHLTESNIEKAEIVLSVKGDIVSKIARFSEVAGNLRIDVLQPIVDRIKAEHGLEAAESFNTRISAILDDMTRAVLDAKDKISTETLKLSGDITDSPDVSDLGEEDFEDDDLDTEDFDFTDGLDEIPEEGSEPVPEERPMKESRKFGVQMESVKGTRGVKYFSNKKEMNQWLNENQNKIKKVLKILK